MLVLSCWLANAIANDDVVVVRHDAHWWTATAPTVPALPTDVSGRPCKVRAVWTTTGMRLDQTDGCSVDVAGPALAGLAAWAWVASPGAPEGPVAELWVLPGRRDGLLDQVNFVQAAGQELNLPAAIGFVPYGLVGRTLIQFPEVALGQGADEPLCRARIDISTTGTPQNVDVTGCPDLFRDAVDVGLRQWGFRPWLVDSLSTASALVVDVQFSRPDASGLGARAQVVFPPDAVTPTAHMARISQPAPVRRSPPMPEGSPAFWVHHPPFGRVGVYQYPLPAPTQAATRCEVLVGVNSDRQVWVWPDKDGCDGTLHAAVESALATWVMVPPRPADGELYARFPVIVVFPGEGKAPWLEIADGDYRSFDLAPNVHTFPSPTIVKRVAPKGAPPGECMLVVTVSPGGSPTDVTVTECSSGMEAPSIEAVRKWRWGIPRADGKPVSWTTRVRVRVSGADSG